MEQSFNPKRLFTVTLSFVLIVISAGYITAIKTAGGMFSESFLIIRDISFDTVSFMESFSKAVYMHFWYTFSIMIFSGNFPGSLAPGIFLLYRSFSIGVCVGLACAGCVFLKAAGICFSVFISNVLVFPIYVIMFFMSFRHTREQYSGKLINRYFSFAAKKIFFFAALCAAECIQSFLGTVVLKAMY